MFKYILSNKKTAYLLYLLLTIITVIGINYFASLREGEKAVAKTNFSPEIQEIIDKNHLVNPPHGDLRLLVISDLNSAYGSTEYEKEVHLAIKMIPFWQPDLIICGGDMIAGQKSTLTPQQVRQMWTAFHRQIAQPIRSLNIPFAFTIGNHDASGSIRNNQYTFQQERELAVEYWQNPQHNIGVNFIDRSLYPFYYTFEQEGIFFLVWDASTSRIPPDKLAWVEKNLSSKTAQEAKMRIVIGHLPLYGVAKGRDKVGEVLDNAQQLQDLLTKYNVHTYISGHQHAYYPAQKENLRLLYSGALGSGPRQLLNTDTPPRKTMTLLDIKFHNEILTKYTTYDMQTWTIVNHEELPPFIKGHNGVVERMRY